MTTWCDAATAVQAVSSGDRVFIHGACMTPGPLIDALVARGDELFDVELTHLHTYGPVAYTDEKWRGHFSTRALFVGENMRQAANNGRASYTPVFLSDIPALFEPSGSLPIDVAFIQVSPPDSHGYCSLGASVDVALAATSHARVVVALINPRAPRTHGSGFVHISTIDYAVEWDGPLYEVMRRRPDEVQLQIGRHVASLIEDGATLQLGIGAIPDAVLQAISDHRALGVHTEMFSDGILDLVERGVITGEKKIIDRDKIVASFVVGSRRLLDFIDDNPTVEMRPADYTNNTATIRQFERMATINSALQVDLTGQVCAESIGTRFYSGVGGQMDFMRGAALAKRGRPIIALPATARVPRGNELSAAVLDTLPGLLKPIDNVASRIVPILTPGAAVTTSRAHVHYVVTEYGVAALHGRDLAERARSLISIAAPQFREELERAAYNLHLLN
ncbi:4-hydroxybutyrate CoA-transferase [Dictyobacter sp. S3.2.2.5]|uniref:4-hydroxybutyrate CoA-transferase n=1 Tax=Dictyobacter halimunensis TaxID=3026934 RepID=A0ABQ6FMJ3_9CHLR|nr:4-hydroxybutyrate CoA-transferase [Dictyobacter sp. S3.2.2.5]